MRTPTASATARRTAQQFRIIFRIIVAEGHLYTSKRACTYVCRGMLVTTQSNLKANYLALTTTPKLKNGQFDSDQTNQKLHGSRTMINCVPSINLSFLTNL